MTAIGLLALLAVETAPPPDGGSEIISQPPPAAAAPQAAPAVAPTRAPVLEPPPPAVAPQAPPRFRRYGDQGSVEIGGGLGYSQLNGLLAALAFRYFVIDGVAPGFEGTYVSGGSGGLSYGLLLGALRLVPVRT